MSDEPRARPALGTVIGGAAVVLGLGLLIGAWFVGHHRSSATPSSVVGASDPVTTGRTTPASGPFATGRRPLPGFEEVAVRVTPKGGTGKVFCMLVARTEAQQERGLMTVTDRTLGGYDGMLFAFSADTSGSFWMRNTPMPLSIAYLTAGGRLVSRTDMAPCGDVGTCRLYQPGGRYRMAVEVPQGGLGRLGISADSTLTEAGRCQAKT